MVLRTAAIGSLLLHISGSVFAAANATDTLLDEGNAALTAGNYDVAIAKFTDYIRKKPKDALGYGERSLAYKEKRDWEHAIKDLNQALQLDPKWHFYYNRGVTYHEMGSEDKAIADFTKAIKLGPSPGRARADCLLARAHAYFNKEQAEPAMADLDAAIKLGVNEPDAYVLRGILHKINHAYDRSLADYEKAIALDPNDPRSYEVEAFLLSVCPAPKYRNGKKAIEYATKACELTKWKRASALETLAAAYAETEQFNEAIKFQTKAAEVDSKAADETRLRLYQQNEPFRELNRKEEPVANLRNIKDRVVIKIGQQLNVHFQVNGDQLIDPRPEQTKDMPRDSLSLHFREDRRGRILFLTHSFGRTMKARCLARLKGYDTYFETDILPVPVKTMNPEIWTEPIEELVLFEFKLTGAAKEDEQVAPTALTLSR